MGKLILFGGTGGLGTKLKPLFDVDSLGSKDVNVINFQEVKDFFQEVDSADVVISLVGYNYDSLICRVDEYGIENLYKIIDVTIKGNLNIVTNCIPYMRENGFGRVILMSSILSSKVVKGTSVYSASKSFVDTLVRNIAFENCDKNITCNSIQLGYFDGGMAHRLPEKFKEKLLDTIPRKRLGQIKELKDTIDFIINNEYLTGQNIKVTGGVEF